MHLFALSEENIICRNFAPLYDIDEEAATGTSNGALACYLRHHQFYKTITLLPRLYLKRSFRSLSAFEHYTSKRQLIKF